MLAEADRLQCLQAMRIPVWKLRNQCFDAPCYSMGLSFKGQIIGQVIAPKVIDGGACDQVLLKNIMTSLNLTLADDFKSVDAPCLAKLADKVQLVLIFGRELADYYQHAVHLPLPVGELVCVNRLLICSTYSLSEMLVQPLMKKEVWQHLQAVVRYLDAYAI